MKFPYSEKVLEHFKNPHNVGQMENPDGKGLEGSPACGDMVAVYLKVNPETKVIEDVKFEILRLCLKYCYGFNYNRSCKRKDP